MVVMQEERRIAIRDTDFQDRFAVVGHPVPGAQGVEHQLGAIGDGGNAAVEGIAELRGGVTALHDHDVKAGAGKRQRRRLPVQAATHDGDVATINHDTIQHRSGLVAKHAVKHPFQPRASHSSGAVHGSSNQVR